MAYDEGWLKRNGVFNPSLHTLKRFGYGEWEKICLNPCNPELAMRFYPTLLDGRIISTLN